MFDRSAAASSARGWVGRARRRAGQVVRSIGDRRVVAVTGGPAEGIRLELRHASNEYRDGTIELPVQQALVELLRPGMVFFDIGANVGFFTLLASKATGGGATLVAFEARSDIATTMTANLRRNDVDATVWPVAVGASEGVASLMVADHPGGATIEPARSFDTRRIEHVPQVTIDDLVEQGRVPMPDLVKIDVEGAEPAVIRGMSRTLGRRHCTVIFEVDAPVAADVEAYYRELESQLADHGYRCTRLAPSYEGSGWHVIHAVAVPDGARPDAD